MFDLIDMIFCPQHGILIQCWWAIPTFYMYSILLVKQVSGGIVKSVKAIGQIEIPKVVPSLD